MSRWTDLLVRAQVRPRPLSAATREQIEQCAAWASRARHAEEEGLRAVAMEQARHHWRAALLERSRRHPTYQPGGAA